MSQRAAPLVSDVSGCLRNGRLPQRDPGVNSSNSFNSYARESSPIERPSKPEPLDSAAYHGIAGEIVRAIGPHSESDEAALLVQLLVVLGIFLSRNAYYLVEGSRHYCNLFSVIVGCTGKGDGNLYAHQRRAKRACESSPQRTKRRNKRILLYLSR